ncbi:flavin monoamine oxidase family protein [Bacillus sp. SCS-153A]|uniref:flavin monoamine oxidase family protein n=1 Tax=Rossellomorea sedimentorum TaxID=3115294 RepID=UPI00390596A4
MKEPIIIVGAGLSGLHAASLLHSQGIECKVLDARDRVGGRVLTRTAEDSSDMGMFDLGPTWFWPDHEPVISGLVKELGLPTFEQHTEGAMLFEQSSKGPVQRHIPPEGSFAKSFRFRGGVHALIESISRNLPAETVELETRVIQIRTNDEGKMTIEAEQVGGKKKTIVAGAVILAMPPRLVAQTINFAPSLPEDLIKRLMKKPTWMAGHAKVVAVYREPFWREEGLSGQAMSWAGPLQEIHDASPQTGYGALFGFFGLPARTRQELGKERVLSLVTDQLVRLFGPSAEKTVSLLYKDWSSDPKTAVESDLEPLGGFPNYGPVPTWKENIIFAGTETSPEHGGHLEGALVSAERAVGEVMRQYNR